MIHLYGWNSIGVTGRIHDFCEFWGIVLFLIVVVLEFGAYFYGHRHDWLVSEVARVSGIERQKEDKATEQRHAAETAAIRRQLENAQRDANAAKQQAAPRNLTEEQKQTLINTLSGFSGQKVDIMYPNGNDEAAQFAQQFEDAFKAAGWKTGDGFFQSVHSKVPPIGIHISINKTEAEAGRIPLSVQTLNALLRHLGLKPDGGINVFEQPSRMDPKTDVIQFQVGSKPQPTDLNMGR
jgi:hypothetical protein